MTATKLAPSSPIDDLLSRAVPYEQLGGKLSPFLLRASVLADLGLIGLVALSSVVDVGWVQRTHLLLPQGAFGTDFVVGIAALVTLVLGALRLPMLALGLLGLTLKAAYWHRRSPLPVHFIAGASPLVAIAGGVSWLAIVALVVAWIVIAIVVAIILVAIALLVIVAVFGGSQS